LAAAELDPLLDDTVAFGTKLRRLGRLARYHVFEDLPHGTPYDMIGVAWRSVWRQPMHPGSRLSNLAHGFFLPWPCAVVYATCCESVTLICLPSPPPPARPSARPPAAAGFLNLTGHSLHCKRASEDLGDWIADALGVKAHPL
jgi:hypothetical protein